MFNFTNCDCSEKLRNDIIYYIIVINIIFLLIGTKIEHMFFFV